MVSDDGARRSREVAEGARERTWRGESFLRDLFLGRYRLDLLHPFPRASAERPAFVAFCDRLRAVLAEHVDPIAIDESGEYPREAIDALAAIGAFGMKIPKAYGGLGFSHPEYVRAMTLLGSHDANVTALLSAHQAIGVPQPVKLFGTEDQKQRFLPPCARGSISAFALTEPAVGSDPARLSTLAEPTASGDRFILNGAKLWCTNGTLADLAVVMARNPESGAISAFVVDMHAPGVRIDHRCRFMGLRALANAQVSFENVEVPRDNLIGAEGAGLKIALVTLNTGRLSLPAVTAGVAKRALEIERKWSRARVQWGAPIGDHEAIGRMIAGGAAKAYAMESIAEVVADAADRPNTDIRLEAAAAKEWNTLQCWRILDEALQIRGGRGYESARSLGDRGEAPVDIERMLRDARINLIFEGSSEILHLFMAREAVDKHIQVAGALARPDAGLGARLRALPRAIAYYAWWYPTRWLGWGRFPRFSSFGRLAGHIRFCDRAARKLSRSIFHAIAAHRAGLERRQGILFRAVDAAVEIYAITATAARARELERAGDARAEDAAELADVFARGARRRARRALRAMRRNDDARERALARRVGAGELSWLEDGAMPLDRSEDELRPPSVREILAARRADAAPAADAAGAGEEPGGEEDKTGRPGSERGGPEGDSLRDAG